MNEDIKRHLNRIVEYMLPDEMRHWEESGRPDDHIYNDLAAVQRFLRSGASESVLKVADVVMDIDRHIVVRGGKVIALSRKEFSLLEYLMHNAGVVLTRAMILEHVWDMEADPFTNTVDVHMRFLRHKVNGGFATKLIQTVHGYGYKFDVE